MPLRKEINLQIISEVTVSGIIINWIEGIFKRLKEFHKWNPHTWKNKLKEFHEESKRQRQYLSDCHPTVIRTILSTIIHRTFRLTRDFALSCHLSILDGEKYLDIRSICLSILRSIFIPCIEQLDLGKCDGCSLGLAIESLQMVCNIKMLKLPTTVDTLTFILEDKIAVLTGLQQLTCIKCCTNQILATVARFCPELVYLDVYNSKQVDDSSVGNILRIRSLKSLYIADTSISDTGYKEILQNLPKIRNVSWIKPIDALIRDMPFRSTNRFLYIDGNVMIPTTLCLKCP